MKLEFELPMKAETLNGRLRKHPMAQHREKVAERKAVATLMPIVQLRPLVRVTLVRRGPRRLDTHDNLRGALKTYVDAVAKALRVDDASPLVDWAYDQEPAREYSVRVLVEAIGELPPDTRPPPKPWQLPPRIENDSSGRNRRIPQSARGVRRDSAPREPTKSPKNILKVSKDLRALATPASYPAGRMP